MKLSRLYSNKNEYFDPIEFNPGLNVIYADIRDPENLNKDTHNLGKSLLAKLIDFCFLKGRSSSFFIYKRQDLFAEFIFYLEIQISEGKYLTIKRYASEAKHTLISFKLHDVEKQDFTNLEDSEWDHHNVTFDKAKTILDGYLAFNVIGSWTYRDCLSYSLRSQEDYDDVFKLKKFLGAHKDWKPYLAHVLGLDASLSIENYSFAEKIASKQEDADRLRSELINADIDLDNITALLEVKSKEVESLERQTSDYSFEKIENCINQELVNEVEVKISELNETKYNLSMNQAKIQKSISNKLTFDLGKIEKMFDEAQVYFGDQLVKDYNDVVNFNKAISKERDKYLKIEQKEISQSLEEIEVLLEKLNQERSFHLSILKDKETFSKYKKLNTKLVSLKADIETFNRQKEAIEKAEFIEGEIVSLKGKQAKVQQAMKNDIKNPSKRYTEIRTNFSSFIKDVLNSTALISTRVNKEGNLDFKAQYVDDYGQETSQSDGTTYKKLMCIAYDVSVIKSYIKNNFVHFVYHDGVFENLDDRKSLKLIEEIKEHTNAGIQHIITTINSDVPAYADGSVYSFDDKEITKLLHDGGDDGRLFKMPEW
ncbi:MAG: DUF2326 domain-containing protein [Alphaproteobacteria bacterium]|nr:DUF2326 domain-containing protein [Alphaproteobacteria bacterium]